MSTEENKALVRQFIDEVFNDGNAEAVTKYLRPGTFLAGSVANMSRGFRVPFPDIRYVINNIVAEGDTVAVYTDWMGTNTGAFHDMTPTGKQVVGTAFWFFKLNGGQIVTMVGTTDRLAIREQLGLEPAPDRQTS